MTLEKEALLVSACLMGAPCRYDGSGKMLEDLPRLEEIYDLIPVCGEVMGGMSTPRTASERVGDRVVNRDGEDVTEYFRRGAEEVLRIAEFCGAKKAILKERSPSCGSGRIYDGSFTGTLKDGWGITAEVLRDAGIAIFGESALDELLK